MVSHVLPIPIIDTVTFSVWRVQEDCKALSKFLRDLPPQTPETGAFYDFMDAHPDAPIPAIHIVASMHVCPTTVYSQAALHNLALFTSLAAALLPTPTLYKLAERRSTRHT